VVQQFLNESVLGRSLVPSGHVLGALEAQDPLGETPEVCRARGQGTDILERLRDRHNGVTRSAVRLPKLFLRLELVQKRSIRARNALGSRARRSREKSSGPTVLRGTSFSAATWSRATASRRRAWRAPRSDLARSLRLGLRALASPRSRAGSRTLWAFRPPRLRQTRAGKATSAHPRASPARASASLKRSAKMYT
jgi:hypothetical protein